MPRFVLMEVKQESDVFNYEQKFKMEKHFLFDKKSTENENSFKYMDTQLPAIKQENNNIEEYPGYFQQTDIKPNSNFNQNIDGDNLKGNLVQLSCKEQSRKANYTGKNYTKHWVLPGGILICMFCGNMFTKPLELFYHIVQHLVKKIRYTGQASNHKDMNCELKSEHGQTNNTPAIIPIKKEHTEENIFKCKFCSKSFSIYSRILKHMHTHAKEKPFKCEICSKSFPIISKLVRHMFTHAEEKPFKCEICPKSYTSNYSLVEHMYSHTNNYPFNCEVCSNSFGRKSRLVNHMRKHTGEKPFLL